MLIQRAQSYRWIFFHHRVVGNNLAMISAFRALKRLCKSTEKVGALQDDTEAWELFAGTSRNLNYLSPKPSDQRAALSADAGWPSDDDEPNRMLRLSAQTVIDDTMLVQMMGQAQTLAQAVLGSPGADAPLQDQCKEFLSYSAAALNRAKTFWSAWKTVEEWVSAINAMWTKYDFAEKLAEMFDNLEAEFAEDSGRLSYVHHVQEQVDRRVKSGGPEGAGQLLATNFVIDQLFHHRQYRELFKTHLSGEVNFVATGRWHVAHNMFRPIRDDAPALLLGDGGKPIPLRRESPLVQALEQVEAGRVQLAVYFFPDHNPEYLTARNLQRDALVVTVARALPHFIKVMWGQHLGKVARRDDGASSTVSA